MAIDEAVATEVGKGTVDPTIRFYRWNKPGAVSLSVVQDPRDINLEACQARGITYVRRMTGGRALYHGPQDLTYSVSAPVSAFADKNQFIENVVEALTRSVESFGIRDVEWNHRTSLFVGGKKISGNAQKWSLREGKYYFQHGSIFVALDHSLVAGVYGTVPEGLREKTTSLAEQGADIHNADKKFEKTFMQGKEFYYGTLTEAEQMRVAELVQTKYGTREWNEKGKRNKGHCSTQWTKDPPSRLESPIQDIVNDRNKL
jgi:lipoate-protein ligase A